MTPAIVNFQRVIGLIITFLFLSAAMARAATGTNNTIDLILKPITVESSLIDSALRVDKNNNPDVSCSGLVTLFATVLGTQSNGNSGLPASDQAHPCLYSKLGFDYLIVQIVDWSNGKPQPVTSWLLLSPANTRRPWKGFADKPTTGNRIYGSKTIGFVILHRGIPKPNAADIRYSITVKRKDSVQLTDLKSLLGILSKAVAAGPQETVLAIAGTVENIKALPDDVAFSGTAYLDTAKKTAGAGPDSTFSQTYDDEGYAGWDISASIPLNGISEVQYSSTDDTLQPKTVTRANSYALAHWYPYPVDLKSGYPSWPSLVGGLAIAGKPLNKPFAGVAVGTHKPFPLRVNVFAGAVFNKVFSPAPTPTEPTHLSSHRVTKLMYGIDIPISQLVSALSKSSSN